MWAGIGNALRLDVDGGWSRSQAQGDIPLQLPCWPSGAAPVQTHWFIESLCICVKKYILNVVTIAVYQC